jgi:uncharacterized protein (DUF952 family)
MFASVHLMNMLIYKIMTQAQWDEFRADGTFAGAPIDLADGYIHFSTAEQMHETAAKHFAAQTDLFLAWVEADVFGDHLKWEVSRGGAEFPHLYATWSMDQVAGYAALPWDGETHQFPKAP